MKGKIFNAQEVQAIIAGTKTMFREVIKKTQIEMELLLSDSGFLDRCGMELLLSECPYQVGQKIFVKESFWEFGIYFNSGCYADDCDPPKFIGSGKITFSEEEVDKTRSSQVLKKRPAQHMKQEHSRLTLEITNIKVERLAKISEGDAIKEGLDLDSEHSRLCLNIQDQPYSNDLIDGSAFKTIFAKNWNATHKKPEEKFEANPFVWVVDFKINK
jgi:hypothetical protein